MPDEAGGKAWGIQLIEEVGLGLPPAWVVLARASSQDVETLGRQLREAGIRLLAVRSSAQEEDRAGVSFAGIHESQLCVTLDEMHDAVREVAGSAMSERAVAYRRELGLPAPSGPCAVIVQEMVAGECGGVAFSAADGGPGVFIEAVEGLGVTAVTGTAMPETHLLRRAEEGWSIIRRSVRTQWEAERVDLDGLRREAIRADRRHAPVLSEPQAVEIAEGVVLLQSRTGWPVDVEWAWSEGRLWVLQVRPRTRPLPGDLPAAETWTRANARDVLPEIPSAFARGATGRALNEGVSRYLRASGARLDPSLPMVAFIYGRAAFSDRVWKVSDLLGYSRESAQSDFGGSYGADNAVPSANLKKILRHPVVALRVSALAARAPSRARAFLERTASLKRRLEAINLDATGEAELFGILKTTVGDLGRDTVSHALGVAGAASQANWLVLWSLRRHPDVRALTSRLLSGGPPAVSTRQLEELVSLAETMKAWPGAIEFTADVSPDHASGDYWRSHLPAGLWARVCDWLGKYGHRGPYESDLARPRYGEDLRLLAVALFPLVSEQGHEEAAAATERRRDAAAAAWRTVEDHLGARGARRLEKRLNRLKTLTALRERLRSEVTAASVPLRRIVLELGGRLANRGRLADPSEIWHLTLPEMERALIESDFNVSVAVARERSRRAAWRRVDVPNSFASAEVSSFPARTPQERGSESARTLHGNAVSPGAAEAEVCVVRAPSEAGRFPSGAVLVAPATDPAWTPLFARAAAVVVELGGVLSHAGIVAREYGIPCVANIDGVTRLFHDGDVVFVDGSSGQVTLVGDRSRAATELA
jgi:pyruvate,water dikinase